MKTMRLIQPECFPPSPSYQLFEIYASYVLVYSIGRWPLWCIDSAPPFAVGSKTKSRFNFQAEELELPTITPPIRSENEYDDVSPYEEIHLAVWIHASPPKWDEATESTSQAYPRFHTIPLHSQPDVNFEKRDTTSHMYVDNSLLRVLFE